MRVHNTGAAFSFLAGASGWQRWFFVGLGTVASAFIVWMLKKHPGQKLFCFAVTMIMGGAVGNVVDRLLHGYVVDFIQVHYGGWYFPAFNLADSAITLGAICLILDELLRVRRRRAADRSAALLRCAHERQTDGRPPATAEDSRRPGAAAAGLRRPAALAGAGLAATSAARRAWACSTACASC